MSTVGQVARELGVSTTTVRRWADGRVGRTGPHASPWYVVQSRLPEDLPAARANIAARALERREEGATWAEIASDTGVTERTLHRWTAALRGKLARGGDDEG